MSVPLSRTQSDEMADRIEAAVEEARNAGASPDHLSGLTALVGQLRADADTTDEEKQDA